MGTLCTYPHSKHIALYIGGLWLCSHALDSCISFRCPSVGGCWVDRFYVTSRLSYLLRYCITAVKGNSPGTRDSSIGDWSSRNSYRLLSILGTGCSRFIPEIAGGIAEIVMESKGSKGVCIDTQGVHVSVRKPDFMTQFSMHVITESLLEQFIKQMHTEIDHGLVW